MASIGHPILGDSLYGNKSDSIDRQALHCNKISFIHPILNKSIELISKLPDDINDLILK